MIKKLFTVLLIAALTISLIPNLTVNAQTKKEQSEISSVENYILYLEEKSKSDANAEKILKQFLNLSPEEQNTFIIALQPENYLKLNKAAQEKPNQEVKVQLNNQKEVSVKVKYVSSDEETITPIDNEEATIAAKAAATYKVTTSWAGVDFYLLGVRLGQYKVRLIYQSDLTNALQVYDVEKEYYNYNPGVWTTDVGYTNQYVSGGYAYGGYQWRLNSTATLGGISTNLDFYIKAKHPEQQFKVNSGRDAWSQPWTDF